MDASIGDAAITASESLALGAVVKGSSGGPSYFSRTLQTSFRPSGASIVIAGKSELAERQGILTHLYPSNICLFTVSL